MQDVMQPGSPTIWVLIETGHAHVRPILPQESDHAEESVY